MISAATATHPSINPLQALHRYGQSVWLDSIRRSLISNGELARLVEEDGVRGLTSNPAIFEKAILGSSDYDDILRDPPYRDVDAKTVYEAIAVRDVRDAADVLRPVYHDSMARDGYVSLEVSPTLAHDTEGTLGEARRLWRTVDRPNLMIKVPGTAEGIVAVRQLISEGINVNVTLLFALSAYRDTAEAFIRGLEDREASGQDVRNIASVASFFISRIDNLVDALLHDKIKATADAGRRARLVALLGEAAIANARITYQCAQSVFASARWKHLEARGAQRQRVLWASTSTKDPAYRDVRYVEELIGPDTVNTVPPATLDAFRDHGEVRNSLTEHVEACHLAMQELAESGISINHLAEELLADGLQQFETAFDRLLKATGRRMDAPQAMAINRQTLTIPPSLHAAVQTTLADWQTRDKPRRLWRGDASLWRNTDEAKWLGWMGITDDQLANMQHLNLIAAEMKNRGYRHAVLLGMGGSSLCPEVMRLTFGKTAGYPELHILDSTDPAQIAALENRIDYQSTVFIVSSKSGGTLEPNILKQYFFERAQQSLGNSEARRRFIAITDPGSNMQRIAERDGFHHAFYGVQTIGGRYSALSDFGMVPAAIMGVDVSRFLNGAEAMVRACGATVPVERNPGVVLGAVLGTLHNHGRNKLTIVASPAISGLGSWLEQLVAESTGKRGKGIIPVDREQLGTPDVYSYDRVFAYLRLDSAPDEKQDAAVLALENAGHPVVRIALDQAYTLGQEFFRWEVATAVAGSVIGINPFDQPDVEAAKVATRTLTSACETEGALPPEEPFFEADGIQLFADANNAGELQRAARENSVAGYLKAHLDRIRAADYFALLAFVEMNARYESMLQRVRHSVRDAKRVATCLGFGPRFLHSTGQAYKGGPTSGVFLQVTCDDAMDLPVPGQGYTFGVVKAAQARGDFHVLAQRGRRALRVHLPSDVAGGLTVLATTIDKALE